MLNAAVCATAVIVRGIPVVADLSLLDESIAASCHKRRGRGGLRLLLRTLVILVEVPRQAAQFPKRCLRSARRHRRRDDRPLIRVRHCDGQRRREDAVDKSNLTLLTGKLNASISNAAWTGPSGKAAALQAHDVFHLNRHLLHRAGAGWDDASIRARTAELIALIQQVWPVPPGHKVDLTAERPKLRRRVELIDLITSGILAPGTQLTPGRKGLSDRLATVLPDGRVELDGVIHNSVSAAARSLTGTIAANGWYFFLVDPVTKRRLSHLYKEYLAQRSIEDDDDEDDEDDDE
jgi:hypothetical protein